jgi:ketosteroid isomerase-like protein
MQEEQIREAMNTHWHASAAGDANAEHDIYDDDVIVITLSPVNASSAATICKPCAVIIPPSLPVSTSNEFSEKAISGSRNIPSPTRGDQHSQ